MNTLDDLKEKIYKEIRVKRKAIEQLKDYEGMLKDRLKIQINTLEKVLEM